MALKVKDIMTTEVLTVARDAKLDAVSWLLNAEITSGAPVLDKSNEVVGVISRSDLIDPSKIHGTLSMTSVEEAMTHEVHCVQPDDDALVAVKLMADKSVHRVVVVDGTGPPVGMVTAMDVVRALAKGSRFT